MDQAEARSKYQQATGLYRTGNYAEALPLLEELSAAFPQHRDILFAKAQCLQKLGKRDELLVVIGQLQALGDARGELLRAKAVSEGTVQIRARTEVHLGYGAVGVAIVTCALFAGFLLLRQPDQQRTGQTTDSQPTASSVQQPLPNSAPLATDEQQEVKTPVNASSAAAAGASSGLVFPDPVFCKTRDDWDLDREVARVMVDPRYPDTSEPQWRRESYQDIIDAAREARLDGRKATIHVPGNMTGKDKLRILYASDVDYPKKDSFQIVWGDDEEIVYITSKLSWGLFEEFGQSKSIHLQIRPGTIVLFSALHNDAVGGLMPAPLQEELRAAYRVYAGEYTWDPQKREMTSEESKEENRLYHLVPKERFQQYVPYLHVFGGLLEVRGTRNEPVVFFSDSSKSRLTPFDWLSLTFDRGIVDHAIVSDCRGSRVRCSDSLESRAVLCHHIESGRCGPGQVVANVFRDTVNESIDAFIYDEAYCERDSVLNVMYNELEGITLGNIEAIHIEHNRILTEVGFAKDFDKVKSLVIRRNDFLRPLDESGYGYYVINQSPSTLDVRENFWGDFFWRVKDDGGLTESTRMCQPAPPGAPMMIDYSRPLTSPDSDLDGLTDEEERQHQTKPKTMDTDGDGYIDGLEVNEYKTDPLNFDTDGDGIPDGLEVYIKTNPVDPTSVTPIGKSGDRFYDQIQIIRDAFESTTAKPAQGLASADTTTSPDAPASPATDANVKTEVARIDREIQQGKGVPPVLDKSSSNWKYWQRESYQPIIDAARRAFHRHRDPSTGKPGKELETISVPGSIIEKDTIHIRYLSGGLAEDCWGDDEDLVYITGSTNTERTLEIRPGTIVLIAAFQDDQHSGLMTSAMLDTLEAASVFNSKFPNPNFGMEPYRSRHSVVYLAKLSAKGRVDKPIVVLGDRGTICDAALWKFLEGIAEYCLFENFVVLDNNTENTVIARNCFRSNWGTQTNGTGYIMGNFFGNNYMESINVNPGSTAVIEYNYFANRFDPNTAIAIGSLELVKKPISLTIRHNTFTENSGIVLLGGSYECNLDVSGNSFFNWGAYLINDSPLNIVLSGNYFACGDDTELRKHLWDRNHDAGKFIVTDRLDKPDPLAPGVSE